MKTETGLLALAALVGVGALALSAKGQTPPSSPTLPPVPKQPLPQPGAPPQNGPTPPPGDIKGNPAAVVTPPPPDKISQAESAGAFAKASFVSESDTAQKWTVSIGLFASGEPVQEIRKRTEMGHLYNPQTKAWEPNQRPEKIQALLHSNLADAVIRYAPKTYQWQDLELPGVWYLVAQQA